VPLPIVIASPNDAELAPAPINPDWIIEGTPQATSVRLARSTDCTCSVVAWNCTAGRFNWHYSVDETLYVTAGEVHVTDEKGQVRRLVVGDMAYFPAGSHSIWYVPDKVTKIAFCRHNMPLLFGFAMRAWNKLLRILSGGAPRGSGLHQEGARATAA
jgi:uncharacterized protein